MVVRYTNQKKRLCRMHSRYWEGDLGKKTDTGKPEVAKMFLVISLIRSFFDADYASDVRLKNVGENNPFFGF